MFFADSMYSHKLAPPLNLPEGEAMTQLSDLLNSLNRNDWSTRKIEDEATKLGHSLNFTTASRYLAGDHPAKPTAKVLAAFAAVFNVDVNRLREAAGQGRVSERFELPPEADMLDPDERRAVVNLVRVMARKKGQEHDREEEQEPGTETRREEHSSPSRSEDGSTPQWTGAPIGDDLERQRKKRIADDPAAFGDQNRPGDLDQGELQSPPPAEKSAAWRTENRGKKIRQDQDRHAED